jgi:outer membrane receptor protein involved in Fe transport
MSKKTPFFLSGSAVRPLTAAVAALLGGTYMLQPADAQENGVGAILLEEITVTASRRQTAVQDLPFNITAISGSTLERQRLTNLTDFSRWVPGLTVVDQGARGGSLMTVRGLNVLSLNASEFLDNSSGDTVATYIGEIPLYVDLKMKDLDRVEVLIGPQGTLYGAGTLGGAVRYIPRAPNTEEFSMDVRGNVYSLAESDSLGYETDVVINVPIVAGSLALRGSFSLSDDPGFIDYPFLVREPGVSNPQPDPDDPADMAANLYRHKDANDESTLSGRLALLWNATDSVQATFNYYFQDQDIGARSVNHQAAFQTGRYESGHRFLEPNERENSLLSAEVIADLGFAQLTSATGISRFSERGQRDQTDLLLDFEYGYETFPSFASFTREIADEDRFSQEVRLVSTGAGPWSWIAGVFYNKHELDASSEEFTPGIPAFWGFSLPTGDLEYLQITKETATEQALFGEVTYQVSDRWDVTAGGRWFEFEDEKFISFDIPFVSLASARENVAADDGFLGKLNTSYAFTDEIRGYATLSEGFRTGGVNSVAPCILPLPPGQNVCALPDEVLIESDRTTNFEVGMHSMLRDGRLILNGALYTIEWDDIQTQSTTVNGAIPITANGGSARSRGLELSFQARGPGPWSFAGTYGYNDGQLTSDAPGLVGGEDARSGDRLSGTPEHMASFYVSYARTIRNGWDLDASYGLTASGNVLTKVGMRDNGERLGGYSVHSASVEVSNRMWSAMLYADNLTNKFAETSVRQDPSYVRDVGGFSSRRYFRNVLRPRTLGIEFRYSFGE